jgi:hypothetical protein
LPHRSVRQPGYLLTRRPIGFAPPPRGRFALLAAHADAPGCKHIPDACYEHSIRRYKVPRNTARGRIRSEGCASVRLCGVRDFAQKTTRLPHRRAQAPENASFFLICLARSCLLRRLPRTYAHSTLYGQFFRAPPSSRWGSGASRGIIPARRALPLSSSPTSRSGSPRCAGAGRPSSC